MNKNKTYYSELIGGTVDLKHNRIFFLNGIFSAWHPCSIYDHTIDVIASSAEQLFLIHKALTFDDSNAAKAIAATHDVHRQKEIGRSIQSYRDDLWSDIRVEISKAVNVLKFEQNDKLNDILCLTKEFELVYAASNDIIWGVGLSQGFSAIFEKENWIGQNLLGQSIMKARETILHKL